MSQVFILTRTDYKHHEDYEKNENKSLEVLYVYTTAKAANEAAKEWVEEYYGDGQNDVKQDEHGCDTWTCQLERDDQSHVLVSVVMKELFGDPEDSEVVGEGEEGEGESPGEEHTGQASESKEAQEPPTKRTRRA